VTDIGKLNERRQRSYVNRRRRGREKSRRSTKKTQTKTKAERGGSGAAEAPERASLENERVPGGTAEAVHNNE
jgi:hypothetical protein